LKARSQIFWKKEEKNFLRQREINLSGDSNPLNSKIVNAQSSLDDFHVQETGNEKILKIIEKYLLKNSKIFLQFPADEKKRRT
jgi:hypothetical protein